MIQGLFKLYFIIIKMEKKLNKINLREMPFLKNIGMVMTYKCQIACSHCIIKAGPHRREEISLNDAYDWIKTISEYRNGFIRVLALTGGEPFLNIEKLKKISNYAATCGLLVSAVTNAFWASSVDKAIQILKEVSKIKMISISTDEYHLKSIPLDRVKNAILAARECHIPYTISVCTENENDVVYKKLINELSVFDDKDSILTAITFKAGRALKNISKVNYKLSKQPPESACAAGSSPIIFPNGKIIACIGPVIELQSSHPLYLGNLKENTLSEILDRAEINPILHTIRVWGPKKLITMLQEKRLNNLLPKDYIKDSICNTCYTLMSNKRILKQLSDFSNNDEYIEKVGYARLYYLNETEMVRLNKNNECNLS